jgi:hypothetical protein
VAFGFVGRSSQRSVVAFFAAAWFGWGNAAPSRLQIWLSIGSVLALLVAVAGAVIGFRSAASTAALRDRHAAFRRVRHVRAPARLPGFGAHFGGHGWRL